MKNTNILFIKENFKFIFEKSYYKLSDEVNKVITENWNINKRKNYNLFNGNIICLKDIIKEKENYKFIFYLTDYAHFLASHQNKIHLKHQCRSLYVSALIETSNDCVVFGKMGRNSFESGRYQFIGGGIDLNFIKNEEIDFEGCIKSELNEELGINVDKDKDNNNNNKQVESFNKMYLGFNNYGNISIIYKVKLKINSTELNSKLKNYNNFILKHNKDLEVDKLIFVNKNNYKEKISQILENDKNHIDDNLFPTLNAYFYNDVSNAEVII